MDLKNIILEVLEKYSKIQTNLLSETARNQITKEILEKSNQLPSGK
tara:strand:- start:260 stop:397 length:138 start_codon:yes stop_codon:yes gene_type:complete